MNNVTVLKDIDFIKSSLDLTDSELASEIGISRMSFNRWRNSTASISKNNLEKIYSFAYRSGLRINEIKAQMFLDSQGVNEKILFHGARTEIKDKINLNYSKNKNDFGKAFYVGEDFFQSASFVSNSIDSRVYIIRYKDSKDINKLNYIVNEEWMLAIGYFRDRLSEFADSKTLKKLINKTNNVDLIIAPIADNQMYSIINDFVNGDITNIQCEKSLSATNLGKQYCFKTNKAIDNIEILHECYLCEEEKKDYLAKKKEQTDIGIQKVKYIKREFAGKGKYIEEILI